MDGPRSFLERWRSPGSERFKDLVLGAPEFWISAGPGLVQHLPEISRISVHDAELVGKGLVPGQQKHDIDLYPSFLIRPAGNESFCLVRVGAQTTLDLFGAKKITPFSMSS